ncbi:MAG TPA: M23 family metallopeptidase [Anaerolineales bacterium]|jgi:murein DD-endopeptidase MepM/ murein hydrolase activator NlpD|nr:M23 family metallopeptidase [Anaerolineales bacterium]
MKLIFNILFSLIFVSCTTITGVSETPVIVVDTKVNATATVPAPTATSIPSVVPTLTFTTEVLCDPFSADFCVTDGHFLFRRPIQPPANDRIDPIYGYGSTANGTRDPHHGVEFSNPSGTPVHAAAEGLVIFAGPDDQAVYAPWGNFYGNLVVIEHSGELFTLYAHLSKIDVRVNQKVPAGETIGEVGRTGGAIGSHLHFEVRRGNVQDYFATQNPELWLLPAQDENGTPLGVLLISLIDGNGNRVEKANFTIGYYPDSAQSPIQVYYAMPYSPDLLIGEESVALGELESGSYRIVVETNGQMLERWVEVESGRLTKVVLVAQ